MRHHVPTNVPSNLLKVYVCTKFLVSNILPALIYIYNDMYEMCAKTFFKEKMYVRSKFSCVRSSHDLCVRAHTHSLDPLDPTILHFTTSMTLRSMKAARVNWAFHSIYNTRKLYVRLVKHLWCFWAEFR